MKENKNTPKRHKAAAPTAEIQTLILGNEDEGITEASLLCAARLLRSGETVAFPTETVYGLGANALEPSAILKIFQAKGRPSDNPLIVHISDFESLDSLAREITPLARRLAAAFWPGPLTLVMKKQDHVPPEVTAGLETVAVRMPDHVVARALIREAGVPVAAPSANLSGKPSPTSCEDVIRDLDGRVACILCGEISEIGLESTVVDVTGVEPIVLRPGGVTLEMIRAVVGCGRYDNGVDRKLKDGEEARSPGMKYAHYAPEAEVILYKGSYNKIKAAVEMEACKLRSEGKHVGIMTFDEHLEDFEGLGKVLTLGHQENLEEIGRNLFRTLRAFDALNVDVVLSETVEETGFGKAIMNRLVKAAGYRIVQL